MDRKLTITMRPSLAFDFNLLCELLNVKRQHALEEALDDWVRKRNNQLRNQRANKNLNRPWSWDTAEWEV